MKNGKLLILLLLATLTRAQSVEKGAVKPLSIAQTVLKKGLTTIDLGLYPGSLLMHSMSELAVASNDANLMNQAIELFGQFDNKKINGRGSFISYEAGGSGAAYLVYRKKAPTLSRQVAMSADRMFQTQKQSSEGILTASWAKDSLDQVFIDVAFAVTPYLLYSGLALNKPEYVDKAVFETLELFRILRDPNGLLHQGRGFQGKGVISQDNWSRGNGWGAFALASLVRDLPDSHPQKKVVDSLARSFFTTVLHYQNPDGLWHQEMTDTQSFVETSGSGLLLYAIGVCLEKKVLAPSNRAAFQKGLSGYLAYIARDGSVSSVCGPCLCPGKGTKADYAGRKGEYNDPHGFGPVVLAFTQAARLGISSIETTRGLGYLAENDPLRPRAYIRYMPEANGNILWENDRIAFRVYGPPVKNRVSSGIDVWTKSVSYPVIDKWYRLNAEGLPYHEDRGEGCDFFHVGFGRGDGGTAIWHNGKPYISQPYSSHKVLKQTDDEIEFELLFDPWQIDGFTVSERKLISMKLGSNLFKVVSTFNTDYKGPLTVAIGISFANKPELLADASTGTLTLWESYQPAHGELGTTVIAKPTMVQGFAQHEKDQFVLIRAKAGVPITYYVGAGWTKNPYVKSKEAWLSYINAELPKLTF